MTLKQIGFSICTIVLLAIVSCQQPNQQQQSGKAAAKKIGVLLVNHGSRSESWRNALLNLEQQVSATIQQDGEVQAVRTAFMEYTEPSIATRLRAFDQEGFTDVIMIPVFLTVSSHSFDDIPTLIGQKDDPKSIELFKIEKMERYKPRAKVHIAPLLDFTDLLQRNILSRYQQLAKNPQTDGLTLIAYGDQTYNKEWSALMDTVGQFIQAKTGAPAYSYGWCGHVAHYQPDSTSLAIQQVLQKTNRTVVIPVLVAFDEMFQVKIIGDGIQRVPGHGTRVLYKPDAILPDKGVQDWVIQTSRKLVHQIHQKAIVQR